MKHFVFLFLILSMVGCTHYYYAPNAANIPLFKEKNTFKGKAGIGGGDGYTGGDIQLGYSVTPKIAIMLNSFFAGKSEAVQDNYSTNASHEESGNGSYFELGAGYYNAFGTNKMWVFETYAGAGIGSEMQVYNYNETAKLGISKYFIQPSFGYSSKKQTFEIALGSRFCSLHLKINQNNVSSGDNADNKKVLDTIGIHPSSILWEPSIMIAAGWNGFKFFLQRTTSQNLSNRYLPQENENFIIGIKFTIDNNTKRGNKVKGDSFYPRTD
jgi:hypothetical protein